MASKAAKQLPHEKRKGEAALSDFAEYVEKQQALRYPSSSSKTPAAGPATTAAGTQTDFDHHEELDDILDSLNLSDPAPRVRLRDLLLSGQDDAGSLEKLADVLDERLAEGHGETVFDVGFENNGDSMRLTRDEWDAAFKRVVEAARK